MSYLSVRGVPHYCEWVVQSGGQYPTGKPVLIFLHGWGGSGRYWQQTATALSPFFDCLLYDLRGFGQSQAGPKSEQVDVAHGTLNDRSYGPYELEAYGEDLVILLDTLQLERVYLNAHSMGASIATLFMNHYPNRVIKAILTCNGLLDYDEQAFNQFHQFGQYVVKWRPAWLTNIPGLDRLFMARFLYRPIPASLRRDFLADFVRADHDAALGTMREAVSEKAALTMPQAYTQLTVQTLLVSGEHDQIITAEMGRQAAVLNPLVEHVVIAKTGHFPMLEDAPTYLQAVQKFLQLSPVAG